MYVPSQFREERPEILLGAIAGIGLATLVTATSGDYHATHLPMLARSGAQGDLVLEGHVARANPHWRALAGGAVPSLAMFMGPHAYVSPSWYESKRDHGKVVPTWNYVAVHAQGRLESFSDDAALRAHLDMLTEARERGRSEPWAVADAPADFIAALSRAIVGLRLVVDRLEGSWKMVQHKPAGDRHGVTSGLAGSGLATDQAVAEIMRALDAER